MRKLRFLISVLPLITCLASAGCGDEGAVGPQLLVSNLDASGVEGSVNNDSNGSTDSASDSSIEIAAQESCDDQSECDDGNPCTTDKCDLTKGCVHKNNGMACDDGDKCTVGEMCKDGVCGGGDALACDDNNLCTGDTCDPTKGCVFVPLTGLTCDDGNGCTTSDVCSKGGICLGGPALSCNDSNSCTTDICDPLMGGCKHAALSGVVCDDGDQSTIGDVCSVSGVCKGNSIACDDDNPCTLDGGNPPTCTHSVIVCDDKNLCTDDTCDPTAGCTFINNTAMCDDGNACTSGDKCLSGVCVGGLAPACDDNNFCTTDSCDPTKGCTHTSLTGMACDDGSKCTVGEMCGDGVCVGGLAPACDDNNSCTSNTCDPTAGCTFMPLIGVACNDGDSCTTSDLCSQTGVCVGGVAPNCNDANSCTTDSCDQATGCKHVVLSGAACDDGNPLTIGDSCTTGGVCKGVSIACDDGNVCTTDGGETPPACSHVAIVCNDGNSCTTDTCDPTVGCTFMPIVGATTCDDGNPCTNNDICANGTCSSGPVSCDDGDPCTADVCDPKTGSCVSTPIPKCGTGEICGNGIDDDGDKLVDCQDGECGPMAKAYVLYAYAQKGGTIKFVTADKPAETQPFDLPADGPLPNPMSYTLKCKETPFTATLSSNSGGMLKAWTQGLVGVTVDEKIASAPQYWELDIFSPLPPMGPPVKGKGFSSSSGTAFMVSWPSK